MPDIKWVKIMLNTFDDEKIKIIDCLPERDAILVIWFKLIILAGKTNDFGYIYSSGVPYTEEMLASVLLRPLNTVRLAIDTFKRFKMIEIDEKGIYIINFQKHQNIDSMEKIKEQWKDASKKYRMKQRQLKEGAIQPQLIPEKSSTSYDDHMTNHNSSYDEHMTHHMTDPNSISTTPNNHMISYDGHTLEEEVEREEEIDNRSIDGIDTKKLSPHPLIAKMQVYLGFPKTTDKQPIPSIEKQVGIISQIIKRGFSANDIFECWKQKVDEYDGDFIQLSWINNDIGNWYKRGKKFPNRNNGSKPSSMKISQEYIDEDLKSVQELQDMNGAH